MRKHKEVNQGETHWAVTLVCSSIVTILRQEKNLFQKRFWIDLYDLFFLTQLSLLHTEYATKWLFLRLRANQGQVLSWCSSKTSKKFKFPHCKNRGGKPWDLSLDGHSGWSLFTGTERSLDGCAKGVGRTTTCAIFFILYSAKNQGGCQKVILDRVSRFISAETPYILVSVGFLENLFCWCTWK